MQAPKTLTRLSLLLCLAPHVDFGAPASPVRSYAAHVPCSKTLLLAGKALQNSMPEYINAVDQLVQGLRSEPAEPESPLQVSWTCLQWVECAGPLHSCEAWKPENLYSPTMAKSALLTMLCTHNVVDLDKHSVQLTEYTSQQ